MLYAYRQDDVFYTLRLCQCAYKEPERKLFLAGSVTSAANKVISTNARRNEMINNKLPTLLFSEVLQAAKEMSGYSVKPEEVGRSW